MESNVKTLICDDEETVIDLLKSQLSQRGHHCISATEGQEAFQIISKNLDIELVITDIVTPNMSGTDLVETLRITNQYFKQTSKTDNIL